MGFRLMRGVYAVEQSTEGIAVVDLDGNLLYLNKALAKMHVF